MIKSKFGFTIVELLIVITIMAGFATIGAFGFIKISQSAEIKKHEAAARNLASVLNDSYVSGLTPTDESYPKGSYPPTSDTAGLRGITWFVKAYNDALDDNLSVEAATSAISNQPLSDTSQENLEKIYNKVIYQPLTRDNALCNYVDPSLPATQLCVKFNIYFVTKDGSGAYVISEGINSKFR